MPSPSATVAGVGSTWLVGTPPKSACPVGPVVAAPCSDFAATLDQFALRPDPSKAEPALRLISVFLLTIML